MEYREENIQEKLTMQHVPQGQQNGAIYTRIQDSNI